MQSQVNWLIIANGEPLPPEQLRRLADNKAVMVLDGALTVALQAGISPQIVLGDFDSLAFEAKKEAENQFVLMHEPDQEATDLEKALKYLAGLKVETVTIANASGWRLDHSLYNLRLLKKFHHRWQSLMLVTVREKVFYLEDQTAILRTQACPQPLALLAFTAGEVSSSGLQYELRSLKLEFAGQDSISNALIVPEGRVTVRGGVLLITSHAIQTLKDSCETPPLPSLRARAKQPRL